MAKINGSTLYVLVGPERIAKTTAYELSVEMEQLDKASNVDGAFRDNIARIGSWGLSSDSLTVYDGFSVSQLYDIFATRGVVWLSVGGDTGYTLLGQASIESISQPSEMDGVVTLSVSFKGKGELYPTILPAERFIIDELLEIIIDQDGNFLVYA